MHIRHFLSLLLLVWMAVLTASGQTAFTISEFPTGKRATVRQYAQVCLDNYYNTIGDALTDFETLLRFQNLYLSSNGHTYHPELNTGKTERTFPLNLNGYLIKTRDIYATVDMDGITFTPDEIAFDDVIYKTENNDKGCTFSTEYILSIAEDGNIFIKRKCRCVFYIKNVLRPMDVKIHGIEVVEDLDAIPHIPKKGNTAGPLANLTVDELMAHSASYDEIINDKAIVNNSNIMYYKELAWRNHWLYVLLMVDYYNGQGETSLAVGCLRWNAVRGQVESIAQLGSILLNEGEFTDGIYWTKKAARNGSPIAQFNLGRSYMLGYGVDEDEVEAFNWMLKAAEQGHVNAQIMTAILYRTEDGPVPADYKKSFGWMQKAAAQNNGTAWYRLAEYYQKGIGTEKDQAKVKDCYYNGALAGNADAQYEYGIIEYDAKNYTEALPWLVNAAENGNHKAQFMLGVMYREGAGVDKDNDKANYWFSKAAQEE